LPSQTFILLRALYIRLRGGSFSDSTLAINFNALIVIKVLPKEVRHVRMARGEVPGFPSETV
jgi:hypothetical protein